MTLGERMKTYEFQARTSLLKRMPVVLRQKHLIVNDFDENENCSAKAVW